MDVKNGRWFIEYFNEHEAHMRGIKKYLVSGKTKYQTFDIAEEYVVGKCLILDGKIQSSLKDEYIYHESLVHPAMISHPAPKKVIIIGGGEGATLREVLKHKSVEKVFMIDIDREVVEYCNQYLPEWHKGAFKNKKAKVICADGRKFLEKSRDKYDVIIIDISEPVNEGPAYLLFTEEFYKTVANRLSDNGLISLQAGSTSCLEIECYLSVHATLRRVFKFVSMYQAFVPSFCTPWGFAVASSRVDAKQLSGQEVDLRLKARGISDLRYYDGITHHGIFMLSKDLRTTLRKKARVIRDQSPIYTLI